MSCGGSFLKFLSFLWAKDRPKSPSLSVLIISCKGILARFRIIHVYLFHVPVFSLQLVLSLIWSLLSHVLSFFMVSVLHSKGQWSLVSSFSLFYHYISNFPLFLFGWCKTSARGIRCLRHVLFTLAWRISISSVYLRRVVKVRNWSQRNDVSPPFLVIRWAMMQTC